METTILNDYLQMITSVVTILGLPLALYLFYSDKKKERKEREYGTYNALDDKYIHFLEMCLEKPELDVIEYSKEKSVSNKEKQEQILFFDFN